MPAERARPPASNLTRRSALAAGAALLASPVLAGSRRDALFIAAAGPPGVAVLDPVSGALTGRLALPFVPYQLAIDRAARLLVASDFDGGRLALLALPSGEPLGTIQLGLTPIHIVLDPPAQRLAVNGLPGEPLCLVEPRPGAAPQPVRGIGTAHNLRFTADGGRLVVADLEGTDLVLVDPIEAAAVRRVATRPAAERSAADPLAGGLNDLVPLPGERRWLCGYLRSPGATLVDLAAAGAPRELVPQLVAARLALGRYGELAAIADLERPELMLVDLARPDAPQALPLGAPPAALAVGWFETVLAAALPERREIVLVDLERGAIARRIAVPGRPERLLGAAGGSRLVATLAAPDGVALLALPQGELLASHALAAASAPAAPGSTEVCA